MKALLAARTSLDLTLLAVVLALLAIGLAMVYSASGMRALDALEDPRYFFVQQSIFAGIGLVLLFVCVRVDYHRYRGLALPLLALSFVLLVLLLLPGIGTRGGGATSWLRLGPVGVQPSELAKLGLILYLAFWWGRRPRLPRALGPSAAFFAVVALLVGLIVLQPDLGTATVVVAIALAMYFTAGARLIVFAGAVVLAAAAIGALAVIQPYRLQRLLTFLDPWSDPRGAGFQTIQSVYGLVLGGLTGEGLGAGKEKFGYLPAAYTDSIFAILGNELGLVGTLTVVILFLVLVYKGVRIALGAADAEGALLAAGITAWLGFQAWLNMAVVASLVPLTGITLPFISYGGTSLCVSLIGVGILLNVGRQAVDGAAEPRVQGPARGRRHGGARQPAPGGRGGAAGRRPRQPDAVPRWPSRPRG